MRVLRSEIVAQHSNLIFCALLIPLTFIIYFSALNAEFVSDDLAFAVNNKANYDDVNILYSYFSNGVWDHANEPHRDGSLYRPLWLTWNFVVFQFIGEQPFGWHFSNLLLHALNAILVFCLLSLLFPAHSFYVRSAACLFFLVHPVASQNVAWVSGSTDLLLCLFLLGAFIFYILLSKNNSSRYYVLSLLMFAAALLTKEAAFSLLPILFFYDYSERQLTLTQLPWKRYAGFIFVAVIYLTARALVLRGVLDGTSPWNFSADSFIQFGEYLATYIRMLVIPWPLPFFMRNAPQGVASLFDWLVGVSVMVVAAVLFVRHVNYRAALAIVFTPLAIPLLLAFHAHGLFAARFLYVPLVGMALLITPLINHLLTLMPGRIVIVCVLLAFSFMTMRIELPHWHDQASWARYALDNDSGYLAGWTSLATAHLNNKRISDAEAAYKEALENIQAEDDVVILRENLALLYAEHGNYAASLEQYMRIAELKKYSDMGWTGSGNALWMLQRTDEALSAYRRAIDINPDYADAIANYALLSDSLHRYEQAAWAFEKLLTLPLKPEHFATAQRARVFLSRYRQDNPQ